ncbi:MAG: hypothetical protein IT372_10670 [Polyangiaceae bacterium]|nr:hypothetical protein [Polyangiaceae bacterium]
MSWKDKWSHRDYVRLKRPARRRLDPTARDALLAELPRGHVPSEDLCARLPGTDAA